VEYINRLNCAVLQLGKYKWEPLEADKKRDEWQPKGREKKKH
jgi:hypothetical protein